MRIGHGYDVHRFSDVGELTLGGIQISDAPAMEAHSDGDVLIHALCDAILGALALGDIGHHFPDTDPKWKGANSRDLLTHVLRLMRAKDFVIINTDITVIAQRPRLAKHIPAMKTILCRDMAIDEDQCNIKATTTEKMGYIGRGDGIAVHAVILLSNVKAIS